MAITISGTAATLNRYAVAYSQTIHQQMRKGLFFENVVNARAADNTYSAPNAVATDFFQPYQSGWTPKGGLTFDALETKLERQKVDHAITADDLDKFWEAWRVEWAEVGKDPKEWSFVRYLYEQFLIPKAVEEMAINSWSGIYVAPTGPAIGVAQASADSVTGFAKRFADAVTASRVTPIVTGAFVSTTMVAQIEAFCDAIPQPYRDLPAKIIMSSTNARLYNRDYRAKFGVGNGVMNPNNELRVDATNKQIVGTNLMDGSNRIFVLFDNPMLKNYFWLSRSGFPSFPTIRFYQSGVREIQMTMESYRAYHWEYDEFVFINDQA